MNKQEVIAKLKSSPVNLRIEEDSLAVKMPLKSYRPFCKECSEGKFFAKPRLVFIAPASAKELIFRIDEGYTGEGILGVVAFDEGDTIPSITEFWPSAQWYEREISVRYGVGFDKPAAKQIELLQPAHGAAL